jgi:hypothetical protein
METTVTQPQSPIDAEPQAEHRWLQKLIGEWTYQAEASAMPDAPPDEWRGLERVRPFGELWVIAEADGATPGGGTAQSIITLGYDPQKQRFVGTWVGSMMTHMWVYSGQLDPGGKALLLESEGPDFEVPGKVSLYRDIIEFVNDDYRLLRAEMQRPDGTWHEFMRTGYRRKK